MRKPTMENHLQEAFGLAFGPRVYGKHGKALLLVIEDQDKIEYEGRLMSNKGEEPTEARDKQILEPPMPAPNPNWKWLSPTSRAILLHASPDQWKPAREIAEAAGLVCDREFTAILRDMCERGMLKSEHGRGYKRLDDTPPDDL